MMRSAFLIAGLLFAGSAVAQTPSADVTLWQGNRALGDVAKQVAFGARAPDTPGHQKTIDLITAEFRRLGIAVQEQQWNSTVAGQNHTLTNLVGRLYPKNPKRILLGTHYDSIIRAYRDKDHPDAVMPGANNSASGVALLLETARALHDAKAPPPVGIDFVFFDGEEGPLALGAGDPHWQPLGSPYFVQNIATFYPDTKPSQAVIFDMVCGSAQKLQQEQASLLYAADQVTKFWNIGRTFAPAFYSNTLTTAPIYDDQLALGEIKIPAFLVIGFDYEPWFNTTQDTPDKCSEAAINAVGRTLFRYIYLP